MGAGKTLPPASVAGAVPILHLIPGANGGRGSRSDSAGVRPAADRPKAEMVHAIAPMAAPARSRPSLGTLAGVAAGGLIAGSLFGAFGFDQGTRLGFLDLLLGGSVVLLIFVRRFQAAHARALPTPLSVSTSADVPADRATAEEYPSGEPGLAHGIRDIRRTDSRFDPTRFAGYTGMVFRDAQAAWTAQDMHAVRDRVTPESMSSCKRSARACGRSDRRITSSGSRSPRRSRRRGRRVAATTRRRTSMVRSSITRWTR